jgi:hypothetical protein
MGKFSSLSESSYRRRRQLDDEDPAAGLANLADCMLVLACGLMVALVVAWNIDIKNVTEVEVSDQAQELTDSETIDESFEADGSTYEDVGRVYKDPETGKLYVIENE